MTGTTFRLTTICLIASLLPVAASGEGYSCAGRAPDWTLEVSEAGATLDYQRQSELDIALRTRAEGADWPRALTLIGRGDSAILLLEPQDSEGLHRARVLTQRGETPILLIGQCQPG